MTDHPNLASTDRSLPFALIRAREAMLRELRPMLAEAGVSEPQWRILRVLIEAGPLSGHALAEAACLQQASVSRLVHSMVERNLLVRDKDQGNRRRQIIAVSPAGRALIAEFSARSRTVTHGFITRFGEERYALLLDLLGEFNALTSSQD